MEVFALPVNAGKPIGFSLLDENIAEKRPMFTLSLILRSSMSCELITCLYVLVYIRYVL